MRRSSFHREPMKAIAVAHRPLHLALTGPLLLALGSCVAPPAPVPVTPPPPPQVVASPAPLPPPLPRPPADWRDAPQTPGTWRWGLDAGRSSASFGPGGLAPLATLSCNRLASRIEIARATDPLLPTTATAMQIETSTQSRPLSSDPALGQPGWLVVALPARDHLLDAMAFSRGRFALGTQGLPTLYLPSWPEIARVIEDCRAGA